MSCDVSEIGSQIWAFKCFKESILSYKLPTGPVNPKMAKSSVFQVSAFTLSLPNSTSINRIPLNILAMSCSWKREGEGWQRGEMGNPCNSVNNKKSGERAIKYHTCIQNVSIAVVSSIKFNWSRSWGEGLFLILKYLCIFSKWSFIESIFIPTF